MVAGQVSCNTCQLSNCGVCSSDSFSCDQCVGGTGLGTIDLGGGTMSYYCQSCPYMCL